MSEEKVTVLIDIDPQNPRAFLEELIDLRVRLESLANGNWETVVKRLGDCQTLLAEDFKNNR